MVRCVHFTWTREQDAKKKIVSSTFLFRVVLPALDGVRDRGVIVLLEKCYFSAFTFLRTQVLFKKIDFRI